MRKCFARDGRKVSLCPIVHKADRGVRDSIDPASADDFGRAIGARNIQLGFKCYF